MRDSAYRVAIWGPGTVGTMLLKLVVDKPEIELVGVLAYSPAKDGLDVGTYLGREELGVRMTTDKVAFLELDVDCVLYCPQASAAATPKSLITADVLDLLARGRNVVTCVGYYYPLVYGDKFVARIEEACAEGGSTLHSTGLNPGILTERITATLTSLCTHVESITVQETGDHSTAESVDMMSLIGFGQPPPVSPLIVEGASYYYRQSLTNTCRILGKELERVDCDSDSILAAKDYDLGKFKVAKGTVACVVLKYRAIVEDKPFLTLEEYWHIDPSIVPLEMSQPDHYTITVEGSPVSLKVELDLMASVAQGRRFAEGDSNVPAYWAVAVPMIQAIPLVCAAEPGLLMPTNFANYTPDLRQLADR